MKKTYNCVRTEVKWLRFFISPFFGKKTDFDAIRIYILKFLCLLQSINAISSDLNNEKCKNSSLPLLCNATHLFCGNEESNVDLEEKCLQVRDYDCAVEWRILENIFGATLPDCTSFAVDGNITFSKAPALNCSEEFDIYCNSFCLPSCERFYQISKKLIIISNYVIIALIAIGLIEGVFTLIVCIFNRKTM